MEWVLLGALLLLGVVATFYVMVRASKGYEGVRARRDGEYPARHCSTCKSRMDFVGLRDISLESRSTESGLGSDGMALEMYQCPTCRKVEFFQPPAALE